MLIHNLSRRLGAIAVLAGALLVAPLAVAAQANTPATHSSAACSAGWFGNRPYCIDGVATVLAKNTAACPGDQQYYPSRDGADVPINWTYANGANACVRVRYNPPGDDATCDYW